MLRELPVLLVFNLLALSIADGESGVKGSNPELRKKYTNSQVLVPGNYELYWNYTLDSTSPGNGNISFAVHVNSTGWVGLGVSINGSMIHSDIGMGWLTADGQPVFTDRYAFNHTVPDYKEHQDWFLLSYKRDGTFITMEFWRRLQTGDVGRDNNIYQGFPTEIVFAWNNDIPTSLDTPKYHDKLKGRTSIPLIPSGRSQSGLTKDNSGTDDSAIAGGSFGVIIFIVVCCVIVMATIGYILKNRRMQAVRGGYLAI